MQARNRRRGERGIGEEVREEEEEGGGRKRRGGERGRGGGLREEEEEGWERKRRRAERGRGGGLREEEEEGCHHPGTLTLTQPTHLLVGQQLPAGVLQSLEVLELQTHVVHAELQQVPAGSQVLGGWGRECRRVLGRTGVEGECRRVLGRTGVEGACRRVLGRTGVEGELI